MFFENDSRPFVAQADWATGGFEDTLVAIATTTRDMNALRYMRILMVELHDAPKSPDAEDPFVMKMLRKLIVMRALGPSKKH